jgi:nucleoid DNA-binding protein
MLENYIKETLLEHGKVSIPKLGVFQKEGKSSDSYTESHSFSQPKAQITFDGTETDDDGSLLITVVARDRDVSAADAQELVEYEVEKILNNLEEYGEYKFPHIGTLNKNSSGVIQFESNPDMDINEENFGLPDEVVLSPVEQEEESRSNEKNHHVKKEYNIPEEKKGSDATLLITIFVVLALSAGAVYFFFFRGKGDKKPKQEVALVEEVPEIDSLATDITSNEVSEDNTSSNSGSFGSDATISSKTNRYYVIVGGFNIKDNATRLKEKLSGKGLDSKIIEPTGRGHLYKVSLGDFDTFRGANSRAKELAAEYENLWVMKY